MGFSGKVLLLNELFKPVANEAWSLRLNDGLGNVQGSGTTDGKGEMDFSPAWPNDVGIGIYAIFVRGVRLRWAVDVAGKPSWWWVAIGQQQAGNVQVAHNVFEFDVYEVDLTRPLPGATVKIYTALKNLWGSGTTDQNGKVSFTIDDPPGVAGWTANISKAGVGSAVYLIDSMAGAGGNIGAPPFKFTVILNAFRLPGDPFDNLFPVPLVPLPPDPIPPPENP